jgi:ligand-binding sensor domain-containing protein
MPSEIQCYADCIQSQLALSLCLALNRFLRLGNTILMNDLPVSPRHRPLRWWIVPLLLIAICIVAFLIPQLIWMIRYGGMPIAAMTGGFLVDCAWDATAQAWVDLDHNGKRDQNDPPLPGVMFHVDDILNKYVDVAGRTGLSNWKGESKLSVWLPGCPSARFEIYPDTPPGYRPISEMRIAANVRSSGKTFTFGFAQLDTMPTITPRPPTPICESFRLGISNRYDITDITVAPDGSVWVATFNDGLRWLPPGQSEWLSIRSKDGLINDQVRSITPLPNGIIWFATNGGASSFDGQRWVSVSSADGLVDNNVYDIAVGEDGDIWFATYAGVSRLDPSTSTWTSLPSSNIISAIAIAPDGTPWVAPSLGNVNRLEISSSGALFFDEGEGPPYEYADQLSFAPDGTLWMAGYDGVARFNPISGEYTVYDGQSTNGAISGYTEAFAFSPDGSIWIAGGAYTPTIYNFLPWLADDPLSAWRIYDTQDGLPSLPESVTNNDSVKAIAVSASGDIWVATTEHATRCSFEGQ